MTALNYYTNEEVVIPLNPTKSPSANAQYYYKQYNRMKTRERELQHQIQLTKDNIDYFQQSNNNYIIFLSMTLMKLEMN